MFAGYQITPREIKSILPLPAFSGAMESGAKIASAIALPARQKPPSRSDDMHIAGAFMPRFYHHIAVAERRLLSGALPCGRGSFRRRGKAYDQPHRTIHLPHCRHDRGRDHCLLDSGSSNLPGTNLSAEQFPGIQMRTRPGLRGRGFSAFSSLMASDPFHVAFGGLPRLSRQKRFNPEALKFRAAKLKPASC